MAGALQAAVAAVFTVLTSPGCGDDDCASTACATARRRMGKPDVSANPNDAAVEAIAIAHGIISSGGDLNAAIAHGRRDMSVASSSSQDSRDMSLTDAGAAAAGGGNEGAEPMDGVTTDSAVDSTAAEGTVSVQGNGAATDTDPTTDANGGGNNNDTTTGDDPEDDVDEEDEEEYEYEEDDHEEHDHDHDDDDDDEEENDHAAHAMAGFQGGIDFGMLANLMRGGGGPVGGQGAAAAGSNTNARAGTCDEEQVIPPNDMDGAPDDPESTAAYMADAPGNDVGPEVIRLAERYAQLLAEPPAGQDGKDADAGNGTGDISSKGGDDDNNSAEMVVDDDDNNDTTNAGGGDAQPGAEQKVADETAPKEGGGDEKKDEVETTAATEEGATAAASSTATASTPSSESAAASSPSTTTKKNPTDTAEVESARRELVVTLGKEFSYMHGVDSLFWSREASRPVRYRERRYEGHGTDLDQVSRFWDAMRRAEPAYSSYIDMASARVSELKMTMHQHRNSAALRGVAMVVMLDPQLQDPDTHGPLLSKVVDLLASLPTEASRTADGPGGRGGRAGATRDTVEAWWSTLGEERFRALLGTLHQFITFRILSTMVLDPPTYHATAVLAMLHRVNEQTRWVEYSAFHNDAVNEYVAIDSDYEVWRRGGAASKRTFCHFPFVLNTASKSELLEADARWQMAQESRSALLGSVLSGQRVSTRLVLHVRREFVVRDTLTQISARQGSAAELKKPLFVKFRGEEGQDEGGVRKEFFQLIVKDLFDPSYAMFVDLGARGCYWFSNAALGSAVEYELIGTILGLAIYNSVILDARFPVVVYRKLLGEPVDLRDLAEIEPDAARGLQQLLDYDEEAEREKLIAAGVAEPSGYDVASVFSLTFEVSFEVLGEIRTEELVPGGASMPVTASNRKRYVDAYVDFSLNRGIASGFEPFARGFRRVCGGFALGLFRPEELELLISGSPDYDFAVLESSTRYDGGYTKDTPVVKWFWEVVRGFDEARRRKLLAFSTGSDRVPIRGLSALGFRILRAGGDSDNLPTAQTCFNYLLLPEYSSKEKLERLLGIAITHSEGFGIL